MKRSKKIKYLVIVSIALLLIPHSLLTAEENEISKAMPLNKLAHEKSPYLLQHADNPVQWFPWSDEAFQKARDENKPIFLSIGYSTCHWCHVMEHESFENEKIAALLNEYFISIKVDREERPDVDAHFMKAVQIMTGGGGWPLNVFLTPKGEIFYGGTYFPAEDKWGRTGFVSILQSISSTWKTERSKITASAEKFTSALTSATKTVNVTADELNERDLELAFQKIVVSFDRDHGGIGYAPKFPMAHVFAFLLRYYHRSQNDQALAMVEKTLQEIGRGGIYDQLNGGVHRYSVDLYWRVPHFEKMLYDQAMAARLFLEAYQVSGKDEYREKGRNILDFVAEYMRGECGGFFSAIDADSTVSGEPGAEKKEGAYYLWTYAELEKLFDENLAEIIAYRYGLTRDGNTLSDPHNEFVNANVFYEAHTVEETAEKFDTSTESIRQKLSEGEEVLRKEQKNRSFPHVDDKMLTDWNGLMIASFAYAGRVLNDKTYINIAKKGAEFIFTTMQTPAGRLMHRYREEDVKIEGFLDDYAFYLQSLIELYYATQDTVYIKKAVVIADMMRELFEDREAGGFYFVTKDTKNLLIPQKDFYDGAIPSGNGVAVRALLELAHLTGTEEYSESAEKALRLFASETKAAPQSHAQMLMACDYAIGPLTEVAIITAAGDSARMKEMKKVFCSSFLPRGILSISTADDPQEALPPFARPYTVQDDKTTAYVCSGFACFEPTHSSEELMEYISTE